MALAARLAGVREEDFKALNPSLHRPVILAAGTPQILLPWDNAKVFERNFEAYNQGQYASWTVWTLPRPCRRPKRHAGSAWPNRPAHHQRHPTAHADQGGFRAHRAALDHITLGRRRKRGRQRPDLLTPEQVTRRTTVRARKNDSVASIARRYRLSAASVADWNDVKTSAAFKVTGGAVCACTHRSVGAGPPGQNVPLAKAVPCAGVANLPKVKRR